MVMEAFPVVECRPAVVHWPASIRMTAEQFWEISQANPEASLELSAEGDLVIMPPTGGSTGAQNHEIELQLGTWAKAEGTGMVFGPATGFVLPNGAIRSPDVAWVRRDRLVRLTATQKTRFLPLCPDFVVELRSPSDSLAVLEAKMAEYAANGARLGWLIDPGERRVYVYRSGAERESIENPTAISGEPVLHGFVLDVRPIWNAAF